MHSIIHKYEAVSKARHLVVLGFIDSDWSKIALSKVEHDFVVSKLAIGESSIHINQYSRSIFIERIQEESTKSNTLEKARERGAKLVKQFNEKPLIKNPINLGYFIFKKKLISEINTSKSWINFLNKLIKGKKIFTNVTNKKYFSFDNPREYNEIKTKFKGMLLK